MSAKARITVPVTVEVDTDVLWAAVFGSGAFTWSWWHSVEYLEGDWDKPGLVKLGIEDPDDESKTKRVRVSINEVVAAVQEVIKKGYVDTCTGRPITLTADPDFDACVGDVVLQQAVLGEVVYG